MQNTLEKSTWHLQSDCLASLLPACLGRFCWRGLYAILRGHWQPAPSSVLRYVFARSALSGVLAASLGRHFVSPNIAFWKYMQFLPLAFRMSPCLSGNTMLPMCSSSNAAFLALNCIVFRCICSSVSSPFATEYQAFSTSIERRSNSFLRGWRTDSLLWKGK